jgi:hypothetical protein
MDLIKPQIIVPRVTPLDGVSTSIVTPVDCMHNQGVEAYGRND